MKTEDEYIEELQNKHQVFFYGNERILIAEAIKNAKRDAFEAGAKAERESIINDVWGSWAQAECEKAPTAPFPGETK